MKYGTLIFSLVFCFASAAFAQAPSPNPQERTSTFRLPTGTRNPFWPLGFKKGPAVPVRTDATPAPKGAMPLKVSDFKVTTISLTPYRVAIVNGRECTEGDILKTQTGPVRVIKVRDGDVVLANEVSQIAVPLQTQ